MRWWLAVGTCAAIALTATHCSPSAGAAVSHSEVAQGSFATSSDERRRRRRLDAVDFAAGLAELKKYKDLHGDTVVPQSEVVTVKGGEEIKLGKWVQRLRQLYKNTFVTPKARANFGQMTDTQKSQLDALGFMFELPDELKAPPPTDFGAGLAELKKYKEATGDLFVPQAHVVTLEDGTTVKLGKWVQRQRQLYKNTFITPKERKGFGQMSDEERAELEAIDFPFELPEDMKGPEPIEWDGAFAALEAYKAKHGDCFVPQAFLAATPDGTEIKLGKWVQRQRQVYKNTFVTPGARKSFGKMTDDQKGRLDGIGFPFEVPEDMRGPPPVEWDAAFEALQAYQKEHGDTKVPEKTLFGELDQDLGKWCQRQRQLFKNTFLTPRGRKNFGQMSAEQREKLESVGFDFPE